MLKRIGFIGAGKVGVTLGIYLRDKGMLVKGYTSRTNESALWAAQNTGTTAYPDIMQFVMDCDIIIITTPDDEIKNVWQKIKKFDLEDKFIIHTSGALSSDVFDGVKEKGAYGYSVHPIYVFPDKCGDISGLDRCFFTIEGDKRKLEEVKAFISGIGNKTSVIDSSKKTLYHAANVFVSNLMLALLSIGEECLKNSGMKENISLEAIMPLITTNIENIAEKGFINAMTGPVERNDYSTIEKHLQALPEEFGYIYGALSLKLINMAEEKHPGRDYRSLENFIKQYMEEEGKRFEKDG